MYVHRRKKDKMIQFCGISFEFTYQHRLISPVLTASVIILVSVTERSSKNETD